MGRSPEVAEREWEPQKWGVDGTTTAKNETNTSTSLALYNITFDFKRTVDNIIRRFNRRDRFCNVFSYKTHTGN